MTPVDLDHCSLIDRAISLNRRKQLASFFSGSAALATLTIPYELALSDFVARKKKLFKSVCCILPLLMVRVLDNYFFDDRPKIVT